MMCTPKLNNRGDWFKQELHQQDSWWDKFIETRKSGHPIKDARMPAPCLDRSH